MPEPPKWKIWLSDVDCGTDEEIAVLDVIRSGWFSMGPQTRAFEEEFAQALGVKHALAVANGTAALHLSLLALGIGPGDEVIQPGVNFVAAANSTLLVGAKPVLADICSLSDPTINPTSIRAQITPNTKAVVVMHYGGAACQMEEILDICRERKIAVIEDACHGVGGKWNDKCMGAIGDLGCFSFFSNKNMTTGEGGMVTTDSDDLAERVLRLRSHGMTSMTWDRHRGHAATYDVVTNGLNYRMDELRAALGRVQLKKLPGFNSKRRDLAREYHRVISVQGTALIDRGWIFPPLDLQGDNSTHHLMAAVAPSKEARWDAADRLRQRAIQSSLHYPLISAFKAFGKIEQRSRLSVAAEFCNRVITLPLHPNLNNVDVETVVDALAENA